MAQICCTRPAREFQFYSSEAGTFRHCPGCGTGWAYMPPGWWRKIGETEPDYVEPAEGTHYDSTLPPEFSNA